jgi:CelD/BcsL family acetyltransferase involved in cellulose biosynthesis
MSGTPVYAPKLITELSDLTALETEWDALALANGMAMMSPACVMGWWRHLAPPTARPRVVAVFEASRLIGLAPFYLNLARPGGRLELRLPGIELAARLSPLATPGREWEVAGAVAGALARSAPRPHMIALESLPLASPWAPALRAQWPGAARPLRSRYQVHACPSVSLRAESFQAWLDGRSANFRGQMRRMRRRFAAAGGTARSSTLATLRADIGVFLDLHASRWREQGGSNILALGAGLAAMLEEIGTRLIPDDRFRLRILELDGQPISAQLFFACGGEVLYVNGGWDDRHARFKPAMLGILDVVEAAFQKGERRVDLGPGAHPYKLRFADGEDPVSWTILIPVGASLPLTCLRVAPIVGRTTLRNAFRRHLTPNQIDRYRALRARARGTCAQRAGEGPVDGA